MELWENFAPPVAPRREIDGRIRDLMRELRTHAALGRDYRSAIELIEHRLTSLATWYVAGIRNAEVRHQHLAKISVKTDQVIRLGRELYGCEPGG